MFRAALQRISLVLACLAICFLFVPAMGAATFILSSCPVASTSAVYNYNSPADDFVLQCALIQGSVNITAHSITVDGFNGGMIQTAQKEGMDLKAYVNNSSNPACLAPNVDGADIRIINATLQDDNSNGGIRLKACGNIAVDPAPGGGVSSVTSVGAEIRFDCYNAALPCTISVASAEFHGNRIVMFSQGDLTLKDSVFATIGPRDQQTFVSLLGSVLAGAVCTNDECHPCEPACTRNSFSGGIESNFFSFAMKYMDFSGDCIDIAENITMAALETNPAGICNNKLPEPPVGVNVSGAEIRDDFGKTGFIAITAHPAWKSNCSRPLKYDEIGFNGLAGDGTVSIDNAILVDDGAQGGGVDPTQVANINGAQDIVAGNCAVTPTCNKRPIPARGSVADQASRAVHHATGVPRCDS